MKFLKDKINNPIDILYIMGFLFGFLLPISTKLSNISLIGFCTIVATFFVFKRVSFLKNNLKGLKFSAIFLLVPCVISVFVLGEIGIPLKVLGNRITFALLPLTFLFLSLNQLKEVKVFALNGLVWGSAITSVVLLVNNFSKYYATRPFLTLDSDFFNFYYTGHGFVGLIDIHPSYYGMYLLLASAFILFKKRSKIRIMEVLIFVVFTLTIFFLSSRIILFLYFFMLTSFLFVKGSKVFKNRFKTILALGIFTVGLSIFLYKTLKDTYLFQTLTKEVAWELSYNVGQKYNSNTIGDSRVARWKSALGLIVERPILGYGVGKEKDFLEESYRQNNMMVAAESRYDSHNQFLGYTIEGGIVNLVLFLFIIFSSVYFIVKSRDLIAMFFILNVAAICLFENYFNRNAGITFFAFYGTVFLYISILTNKKEKLGYGNKKVT
ncbi:MAG: O-antigen ligase [Psychroserpens sp.]|jgi:O-antigen ligase